MLVAGLLLSMRLLQDVDLYGKKPTDVLKMGSAAWFKFYTAHAGDSTAAMTSGYGIYGDIASKRNDGLVTSLRVPVRTKIKQLRKLLAGFGGDLIAVGSAITGGGTMWNTVAAQQYAETEELVYAVIHPAGQPRSRPVPGYAFERAVLNVPAQLKGATDEGVLSKEKLRQAMADFQEMKTFYQKITRVSVGFGRASSDRIVGFCVSGAGMLKGL